MEAHAPMKLRRGRFGRTGQWVEVLAAVTFGRAYWHEESACASNQAYDHYQHPSKVQKRGSPKDLCFGRVGLVGAAQRTKMWNMTAEGWRLGTVYGKQCLLSPWLVTKDRVHGRRLVVV